MKIFRAATYKIAQAPLKIAATSARSSKPEYPARLLPQSAALALESS